MMALDQELATQYANVLPALEAWHRNPANENTDIGLDVAGIRGVGTGTIVATTLHIEEDRA
ncbi:hypothetical protein [Paraburkholderia sp. RL17-337-BIB-A]|uniref:hypothetical protein n=1 Tax=Paraburkholderia sp. RL17-337-BIB-A TaxID=3031636 RepID=UPI0038B83736